MTPLHYAAKYGHAEVVELLIQHRAQVNALDGVGCTPLHYAALNGHKDVVRILLERGNALINFKTYGGWTPLHLAVQRTIFDQQMTDRVIN